ncbi:uncharacterized protein MICPUCDRAFT_62365 [Micromonas pusilla CCMP1545]|uniref:Predicted protein n=3 Tax=Micromonas pusilla TaxID=38833 RepID=C1MM40_MICPC|nr:uncharacterized protein MICPUCDRAFT_62365 [Micromonas pusilla CCMP1545]EEH58975.1 predicted protein [Micromonas pusilla CCMP1545]|eukprot:XP_003057330.1 predicted protein [Micromonas pusilla CCMP1545]
MLSIKPPPYAAEVIAEANGSATKIESGIFAKSKSNDDYLKRVTAKLNSMKALVQKQRQAESNDTAQQNEQAQGANYDAAMAQQQQSTETRDAPATAAPATAPAPAAAAPAAVAASAAQTTAEKELSQQIFQTVVKNQLDRPEFKSAVTKMTPDERKHALGRVTHATKAAMGGYYKLLREKNAKLGPGKQTAGLNPKALIDHLTVNVASMLSRPPAAAGVGAIGPGRASGASGMEKAKSAAAQQAALAQQRREQSAAAATAGAGLGTPAYWQRVGEMRGAYLPRIKQTVEYMLRTGVSRARDASASTSERLLHFMTSSLIPMLEQTADRPCAAATFKAGELETLDAKIRQLIAITAGSRQKAALAPVAPPPPPTTTTTEAAGAGGTKRARDGDDDDDDDDGPNKKAKSGDDVWGNIVAASAAKPSPPKREPTPPPPKPTAFVHLFAPLDADAPASPPPTPACLAALTRADPPKGAGPGPALMCASAGKTATAVAAVFDSADDAYDGDAAELTRRAFESELLAFGGGKKGGADAKEAWKAWEEALASFA